MARGNKLGDRGQPAKKKAPQTSQEKAEYLIQATADQMVSRIQKGERRYIENRPKNGSEGAQMTLESIEQSLQSLRANLKEQRVEQKQFKKMKLLQAHDLIVKMKRQKDDQKKKITESEDRSILHSRIFSDSSFQKMRQKLEERVVIKRKEIEERIQGIVERGSERGHRLAGQQMQYLSRKNRLKANSQSTKNVPSSLNPQYTRQRRSLQLNTRKNRFENSPQLLKKGSPSKQNIESFLQKLKMKERGLSIKGVERTNLERLPKIVAEMYPLVDELNNHNNQFLPLIANKLKLFGNQCLKQSLLRAKGQQDLIDEVESEDMQKNLELKANEMPIHRNDQTQKLREKWLRVLSKIEHNEIGREQGLELLNSMERRLDKIDIEGMTERLKNKYKVFAGKRSRSGYDEEPLTAAIEVTKGR